jgi:hypothetical protein
MSSAKPSLTLSPVPVDDWDTLLVLPTASSDLSPPMLQSASSSASSGEFNAFSFVGAHVASGGGVGGLAGDKCVLLLLETEALCLGNIGGSKICVRPCVDGKSCGILSHGSRKAKVVVESFYVLENEHKLYNEPKLAAGLLTEKQQEHLGAKAFTRDQWVDLFTAIELGNLPDWLIVPALTDPVSVDTTNMLNNEKELLDLESPKRAAEKTGMFTVFPSLSYEDYDSSEDEEKQKWASVFQDIEANHLMVATDLDKLLLTSTALSAMLGSPPDPSTLDLPIASVW